MGKQKYGISSEVLEKYSLDIKSVLDKNVSVAVVMGGGNIFRGVMGDDAKIDRVQADYMGMLATVINSLALQSSLENLGVKTRVQTAIEMNRIAESFIKRRAVRHLEKGRVVIFAAGTGNPYFTTDTAAILRAIEINADVILKGTRVDGIYTSDPEKNADATKIESISFEEAITKNFRIMDMTAFTLSKENKLPIIIFDMNKKGNLLKVVEGGNIGTIVR
ncbi:uridylate kinase [Ichthyobacterium seriolicida]|uniref:Uridylate kinase n=2 Tax=Ichthyobacterium seriolicida TaxID=242600 RepID=A0A1J1DWU8_9FLAO|nr:uridylate kinase [Ichthyobacterium seriolicida]